MFTIRLALLCLACLATPLRAQDSTSPALEAKLFAVRLPAGWSVVPGEDIVLRPPNSAESELVLASECAASSTDCFAECSIAAARHALYFFKNNDPPATLRAVPRADHLLEYRAEGKFGDSGTWVAASVLCNDSGLAVFLAQSDSLSLATSYRDVAVGSVAWRR